MKNKTNNQSSGNREDEIETKKSSSTNKVGTKQGSKGETGITRAGSEDKSSAAKR
jgi:hypothetical protein